MTLPAKHPKDYLEITDRPNGFAISAHKDHASELEPLFHQYGIPCRRESGDESDALVFDAEVDRAKVEQILLEYEATIGS